MFKQKSDPAGAARPEPADAVQQARTRARHRLIGAIVLLAIGIIGFPLVFETQPRPIPVDIPIEIPRRDAMPPLAMPSAPPVAVAPVAPASAATTAGARPIDAPPAASATPSRSVAAAASRPSPAASRPTTPRSDGVITESARDAGRDITPPSRTASASAAAATASRPVVAAATSPPASGDGERARALLEGREPAAAEGSRFVVQVGAFADAEAAREARKQVDRLGLKTYTQVAQTASGSRIRVRVGPFTSRAEADAALAKAKAAGLAAVVLAL